ncbi:MAG: hypothetical protein JSU70_17690 [Phycisphaerales bacterium]|nr:MAG: hypothetical protein JSU70_17690 [Phycisphaerales bacterium]
MMAKQWTADEVLNTVRAFQPACILAAAADLDIFTALNAEPMTAESLSAKIGTDLRATTILLDALVALQFLTKQAGRYHITSDAAELLAETSPANVLPGVRHLANCLSRWVQLAGVVQTGGPAERAPSIRGQAADEAAFIQAMNNFSGPIAVGIVAKLQPLSFSHLLDIGGASGTWTIEFLRAIPDARATLFDLPSVIPLAEQRIAAAGLADRVTFCAGDYTVDELPSGADFAWLSAIAHQESRDQNRALYAKICAALQDDGVLVIRDVVMDPDHTSPPAGALFAVNMLVGTESGGTYTFDEYKEDLSHAGFTNVELIHRDEAMNSLIRAKK